MYCNLVMRFITISVLIFKVLTMTEQQKNTLNTMLFCLLPPTGDICKIKHDTSWIIASCLHDITPLSLKHKMMLRNASCLELLGFWSVDS